MAASPHTPPLRTGDRLPRDEFERRYAAMPAVRKAELLEGRVCMPSPVHYGSHGRPHARLAAWLSAYATATPGVEHGVDPTLRLDPDNELQPDLLLRIAGPRGASRVDADDFLSGAPELVVEVAASSAGRDLQQKLQVYRRSGVREYQVLRSEDRLVDWFALRGGDYRPLAAAADGILRSEVFPGLWLDVDALLRGDLVALARAVAAGTRTPAHAAFVARLAD